MNLALALTAFLLIVPVELPDKTFVATLVLATRYRPLAVWIGVSAAFFVQTLVAVTLGGFISLLPTTPVHVVAAALFLVGGVILLRGASKAQAEEEEAEEEFAEEMSSRTSGSGTGTSMWSGIVPSFLVLFVAEWGDLSQLLTAGLVAQRGEPVSIGIGAWLALVLVSGLGAAIGRTLLRYVSLATIRRVGGVICLLLGVVMLLGLFGVEVPLLG